jgi:hypothetical protein
MRKIRPARGGVFSIKSVVKDNDETGCLRVAIDIGGIRQARQHHEANCARAGRGEYIEIPDRTRPVEMPTDLPATAHPDDAGGNGRDLSSQHGLQTRHFGILRKNEILTRGISNRRISMPRIVELPAEEGAGIFVEIDESRVQGTQRVAIETAERALEKVAGNFEGALANIARVASGLYNALAKLPRAPDTAKIEFGVKLTGGAGIIIASGTAAANIKIALDWKTPEPRTPTSP